MCHALFDALWRGKPKARRKRDALYEWLAGQMGLPLADCHFGYFDLQQLRQAYRLLSDVQGLPMRYDNRGRISLKSAAQPDRQRHSNGSDRSLR